MTLPVSFEHVCDIRVLVAMPLELGDTGLGERRIIDITGGTISGPKFSGKVRHGGADYQIIRPNGLTELHARYTLEDDAGRLVYVVNDGIRFGPKEALDRIKRGEPVDPALIYFRAFPKFETAAPDYQWMMESLFVCTGVRRPDAVELSIYRFE
ncbi:MAG: DUF3237 domain-containing protein [Beijerinckiaceae bacterium]|nr:DUF3237 domain-containing protein [Beijerinckiaceae bacterium]